MSSNKDLEFTSFESPPVDVANAFENDLNDMYSNRLCPKPFVAP